MADRTRRVDLTPGFAPWAIGLFGGKPRSSGFRKGNTYVYIYIYTCLNICIYIYIYKDTLHTYRIAHHQSEASTDFFFKLPSYLNFHAAALLLRSHSFLTNQPFWLHRPWVNSTSSNERRFSFLASWGCHSVHKIWYPKQQHAKP